MNKKSNIYIFSNKILVIFCIITCVFFVNCADEFGDSIEDENKAANQSDPEDNTDTDSETDDDSDSNLTNDSWKILDALSINRAGAAMVEYNGYIYVYGGEDFTGIRNDFFRYEIDTGNYEALTGDISRAYSSFVEIDGTLYLFGGKTISAMAATPTVATNILKSYNIASDSWTDLTNLAITWPEARYSQVAVAYNFSSTDKYIVVHGGYNDSAAVDVAGDLWFFNVNPAVLGWRRVAASYKRRGHAAVMVDRTIYFFGGYDTTAGEYTSHLVSYNIPASLWTRVSTVNRVTPREAMTMVLYDNNLIIYGGFNNSNVLNDNLKYSLRLNEWSALASGPGERCNHSAIVYDDKVLIFGGYYLSSASRRIYNSELWEYDPEEDYFF